jgi:hypothetical protein
LFGTPPDAWAIASALSIKGRKASGISAVGFNALGISTDALQYGQRIDGAPSVG